MILGFINEDRLKELLMTMGDRFTEEEVCVAPYFYFEYHVQMSYSFVFFQVDEMYREAPIRSGNFDYIEFTRILKHGKKDDQ